MLESWNRSLPLIVVNYLTTCCLIVPLLGSLRLNSSLLLPLAKFSIEIANFPMKSHISMERKQFFINPISEFAALDLLEKSERFSLTKLTLELI